MKYKYLSLALLPIIALFLTACTIQDTLSSLPLIGPMLVGGNKDEIDLKKDITLNVWGLWESPEAMKAVIAKYNETYPNIKINYDDRSVLNVNDYKQTVQTRIAETGVADIMRVHHTWTRSLVGNLEPMPTSLMSLEDYSKNFYPLASKYQVSDGKVYGLPTNYDGLVLVYNKKHFEEIGQAEPPVSWEQFRRLSQQLTIRGENNSIVRAGVAMGTSNNIDMFSDIIGMLFAQAGHRIPDELSSGPAVDTMKFYTNFSVSDKVWDSNMPEAASAFAQGKVSMIFIPSWQLLDIIKNAPVGTLEIGVAPVPQIRVDAPKAWGSFWVYVVPKSSPNAAQAWHFVNFLGQQDQQLMMFNETSKYRTFGSAYSLTSMASSLDNSPYLSPLVKEAPVADGNSFAARSGNERQVAPLREAVTDINNGTPVSDAMNRLKNSLTSNQ